MPEEVTNSPQAEQPVTPPSEDFNEYLEKRESEAAKKAEGTPKAPEAKPAAETAGATTEAPKPQEPPEEEEDDEPDDHDATKPKRKGGFRRTIDKLTRANTELADKIKALEMRLSPPEKAGSAEKPPEQQDKEPVPEDFPDDYDRYVKTYSRWASRQEWREQSERAAKAEAERKVKEAERKVFDAWHERQEAARKQYADYDDLVANSEAPMSMTMQNAMLESEDGAEILYHLVRHPSEAERIAKLPAIAQVRELERISQQFRTPSNGPPQPKRSPVSSAPKPVRPLGGGSAPSIEATPPQSEFYDDGWSQKREADLRAKQRRA